MGPGAYQQEMARLDQQEMAGLCNAQGHPVIQ